MMYALTNELRHRHEECKFQMVVVLISNADSTLYGAIKRMCCSELGVPSQVITGRILDLNNRPKAQSCVTKVAAQMIVKLGGELWGSNLRVCVPN